jgi:hypothetical protein
MAGHQTFEDQPARALALSLTCWRGAAQLGDPGSKGGGSVEAFLEASFAGDPRYGEVVRVTQVGPHAAEHHCHPTLRVLDCRRELVLRCGAASGEYSARTLPAPNQDGSNERCRRRAETCECPE